MQTFSLRVWIHVIPQITPLKILSPWGTKVERIYENLRRKGRGSGGRSDRTPLPLESSGSVSVSWRPERVLWESRVFATNVNYRTGEGTAPCSTQKPPVSLLLPLLGPPYCCQNVLWKMSIKTHHTHHTHHTRTHAHTHTLKTLQDFHPLTFRIKSRCPPITHQGQHDLVTVSDLLPDIPPFCPAHPALHTLALAYPDLGAFMLAAHSAWTQLSPLWLPLGWLFSSNWFLLKWHPLGEAFSAHKSLKIALHPSSIFQSLPWLYFHCRTNSLWKCIAY